MPYTTLTLVARIKAKDGMEEKVRRELMSLLSPTRLEAGCIDYNLYQSTDDKSLFMFFEDWASKDDLEKHRQMPYLKAWKEKAKELLEEPAEVTLWEMITR